MDVTWGVIAWAVVAVVLAIVAIDQVQTRREMPDPRLYMPSPTLGWTLRPGLRRPIELLRGEEVVWRHEISLNAHGFHDREWGPKREGVTRVLVMGDSIIEARQVPRAQTLVAVTEELLNRTGRPYEVFNLGVAGWSADSVLNYFQQVGHTLKPDVVIHGLFVGNDLAEGDYDTFRYLFAYAWDCRRYDKPAFRLKEGTLVRENFPAWRNLPARWLTVDLYERSRLIRRWYQNVNRRLERRYNGSNLLRAQGVSYNMYMEQTKGNAFFYAQAEAQIDQLAAEVHRTGAKFGVMLEPNFPLFYPLSDPDPTSKASVEYQRDLAHYREMERRLSQKYPVLGLIEYLHESTAEITFRPADPHLNATGHAWVAGRLAPFVASL